MCDGKADRHVKKTDAGTEGWERVKRWQHCELHHSRANDSAGDAKRNQDGAGVGQIALRRKQQDHGGHEHDRRSAVRPTSRGPKQLDRSDRQASAYRVDGGRQQVGDNRPEATPARMKRAASIDEQSKSVERLRYAVQHPGSLVGEQT